MSRFRFASVSGLVCLVGILGGVCVAQSATLTPCRDNTLYQSPTGALSNGAGNFFFSGLVGPFGGFAIRRGLVAFDVSSIPAGSTVTCVELHLNLSMTQPGDLAIALHPLLSDWGEAGSTAPMGEGGGGPAQTGDATWLHGFFDTVPWSTPGGDFAGAASATRVVGAPGAYVWTSAQMVADVQAWVNTPTTNFGWLLKSPEATPGLAKRFDSKDSFDPARRPRLVVDFAPPTVLASAVPIGIGCVGSSGLPFVLSANGLPTVGNLAFSVELANGPSGASVFFYLAAGLNAVPISIGPGCFIHLDLTSALALASIGASPLGPFPLDAAGGLTVPVPILGSCGVVGSAIDVQALCLDGSGFILSNALSLVFGS